jgi:FkbM family methyltransferase
MSALKSLLGKAIGSWLLPLRLQQDVLHYAKGVALLDPTEHLYRTARYIKASSSDVRGTYVLDVGAADGGSALWLSRHLEGTKIICLEPNPAMVQVLRVRLRGAAIEIRELAVGGSVGSTTLRVTRDPLASSVKAVDQSALATSASAYRRGLEETAQIQVRQSTLDDEFSNLGEILLLKLDTQGSELDILGSGSRTLSRTRFVLTEMSNHSHYRGGCRYYETDAFLRESGFRLADLVVTYHTYEAGTLEFDALYERTSF